MALSLDDIKTMSFSRKLLALLIVLLVFGFIYYLLFFQSIYEKKASLVSRLAALKQQVIANQIVIKEIGRSKEEFAALREGLQEALTKLPDRKEIPWLLSSLAKAGRDAGLDFVQFEPLPPLRTLEKQRLGSKPKDRNTSPSKGFPGAETFYEEIPIRVALRGAFHDTIDFLQQVANLPRIIRVADIKIEAAKDAHRSGVVLETNCLLKTFVFAETIDEKKK